MSAYHKTNHPSVSRIYRVAVNRKRINWQKKKKISRRGQTTRNPSCLSGSVPILHSFSSVNFPTLKVSKRRCSGRDSTGMACFPMEGKVDREQCCPVSAGTSTAGCFVLLSILENSLTFIMYIFCNWMICILQLRNCFKYVAEEGKKKKNCMCKNLHTRHTWDRAWWCHCKANPNRPDDRFGCGRSRLQHTLLASKLRW